jgi:hypothetical protein
MWRVRQAFWIRSCDDNFDDYFIRSRLRDWNLVYCGVELGGWMDDHFSHFEAVDGARAGS